MRGGGIRQKDVCLLEISRHGRDGTAKRRSTPLTVARVTIALKEYMKASGEEADFTMHSFRSGGDVSQALAREGLAYEYNKAARLVGKHRVRRGAK